MAWPLRGLTSAILNQVMKAETVTSNSFLNGAARSQAAEVHAPVSSNSSEKSILPTTHTYPKSLHIYKLSFPDSSSDFVQIMRDASTALYSGSF